MKYYIGYFNEDCDKTKFNVICVASNLSGASFIFSKYKEHDPNNDIYEMFSEDEVKGLELIY